MRIVFVSTCSMDDPYVDGISLTHGSPQQHIWSFVIHVLVVGEAHQHL